jgi:ferredoxin
MKIVLDQAACVGHGRCYTLGPDVFDADEEGHCVVLVADVPPDPELEKQARTGVANCPERALRLEDA